MPPYADLQWEGTVDQLIAFTDSHTGLTVAIAITIVCITGVLTVTLDHLRQSPGVDRGKQD